MQFLQYVRRVTAHPRVHARQAVSPRQKPPWHSPSRSRSTARLTVITAALCVVLHALASGYALVARVRVEVVPAAAAPGSSGPAACAVAVVRG